MAAFYWDAQGIYHKQFIVRHYPAGSPQGGEFMPGEGGAATGKMTKAAGGGKVRSDFKNKVEYTKHLIGLGHSDAHVAKLIGDSPYFSKYYRDRMPGGPLAKEPKGKAEPALPAKVDQKAAPAKPVTAEIPKAEPTPTTANITQQTKAEYMAKPLATLAKMKEKNGGKPIEGESAIIGNYEADHARAVHGAVAAGKKVPAAVLKDYPSLKGPHKEPWEMTKAEWQNKWAEKNAVGKPMMQTLNQSGMNTTPGKRRGLTHGEEGELRDRGLLVKHLDKINNEAISNQNAAYVKGPEIDELFSHRKAVFQAIKAGKPVPEHVLAGYPDLAKEYGKPKEKAAGPSAADHVNHATEQLVAKQPDHVNELAARAKENGMTPEAYGAAVDKHLQSLVSGSAVYTRVPTEVLSTILGDGRLKSQFETHTGISAGVFGDETRGPAEKDFFGFDGSKQPVEHRPIYGYLETKASRGKAEDPYAMVNEYGGVAIELKPHVHDRTTVFFGDSLTDHINGEPVHNLRGIPQPMNKVTNLAVPYMHLADPLKAKKLSDVTDIYTEAQIHGGVSVGDIAAVHFNGKATPEQRTHLKKLGIAYTEGNG